MQKRLIIFVILFLIVITFPYILASVFSGSEYIFQGFLINPIDGNSYLAKMYEGWSGSWKFFMPYTADRGAGGYLFLFYLALGHLARLTGLTLLSIFHIARVMSAGTLLMAIFYFLKWVSPNEDDITLKLTPLTWFGSGMGWMLILLGIVTSDLWVPEAFPFLASFTNPHFTFALTIFLVVFTLASKPFNTKRGILILLCGLLLSIIMPFGAMLMILIMLTGILWDFISRRDMIWKNTICFAIGAIPYMLYVFWLTNTDLIFSGWNAQNQTPSPPVWDLLISLSPPILFAYWGIKRLWNRRDERIVRTLFAWLSVGLILVFIPFSLQRRFMFGIYFPVAVLGTYGILELTQKEATMRKWLWNGFATFSVLSNISLLVIAGFGIVSHSPNYYYPRVEQEAFSWIQEFSPVDAIILASPRTGLLIPAYTGRRVIYGHPFETVNAANELQNVNDFFKVWDRGQEEKFLRDRHIDYIFFGSAEQNLGTPEILHDLPVVFRNGGVSIYKVNDNIP